MKKLMRNLIHEALSKDENRDLSLKGLRLLIAKEFGDSRVQEEHALIRDAYYNH